MCLQFNVGGGKLKHRRLLIGSIIGMCAGIILALIIGPAIAYAGVSSHWEGWWIFGYTVTELTSVYWVGFGITIAGLSLLAAGGFGVLIACLLEILDRRAQTSQPSEQHK